MGDHSDDFDEIVQHLDLDLSFPDESSARRREHPSVRRAEPAEPAEQEVEQEPFYRQVGPGPLRPRHAGRTLAWIAVIGAPVVVMLCTIVQVYLSRPLLLGIALTFVAASIYLISQLPEHGPGRPDWPDDGAEL